VCHAAPVPPTTSATSAPEVIWLKTRYVQGLPVDPEGKAPDPTKDFGPADLSRILPYDQWRTDAHFAAYYAPGMPGWRVTKEWPGSDLPGADQGVEVRALVLDVDCPDHADYTEEWHEDLRPSLASLYEAWGAPGAHYPTAHGLRLIWALSDPYAINQPADGDTWAAWYLGKVAEAAQHGLLADHKCADWTRQIGRAHV